MGILTGDEIAHQCRLGRITIDPFGADQLGPNSYDLTLSDEMLVYSVPSWGLDMRLQPLAVPLSIPPGGLMIQPGMLYLGATAERCGSDHYVCCLEGRSSVGRLGVGVHVTAGFGDLGFAGRWTLEITAVHPIRVYAGVRICQAYFLTAEGAVTRRYQGRYKRQSGPTPSGLWRDFRQLPPTKAGGLQLSRVVIPESLLTEGR